MPKKSTSYSRLLLVDCISHYGNDLVASVFFNVHLVRKSPTEFYIPICAFMELHFNDNLPCLINLALYVK